MEGYKVEIIHSTKELTVREKIRIKDLSNAIQLDDATQQEGNIVIDFDYYVILMVHNEFSRMKRSTTSTLSLTRAVTSL